MKNTIVIKGLKVFGYHGIHDEEKSVGQEFIIDVYMAVKNLPGCITDKIDDTVSYSEVAKFVKEIFVHKSCNLIECVGEKLARAILDKFRKIDEIKLVIKKPNAPISELEFEYVGVEIFRKREDYVD